MPETLGQDPRNNRFIKLGVLGCYIAEEDTAYDAASGWTDLGVMDPGTFNCDFPREMFELRLGFPRAVKMEAVVGTGGMIDFGLTEYSPYAAEVASGSGPATRTYATSPAATTVASGGTTTGAVLTSGSGAAPGQMVEITTSSGAYLSYLDTVNGATVTWKPAIPTAPTNGAFKYVKQIKQALGSVELPRWAFKAVFVDQWGEKVTLYLPACSVPDGFKPNFGDATANVKLAMKFKAYGKDATWQGKTQQIVGYIIHDMYGVT